MLTISAPPNKEIPSKSTKSASNSILPSIPSKTGAIKKNIESSSGPALPPKKINFPGKIFFIIK